MKYIVAKVVILGKRIGNKITTLIFLVVVSNCFSLDVEDNDAIVDGKFQLQCNTGGVFEDSEAITWPTCIVKNCTQLLTQSGYVGDETEMPVAVGDEVGYRQGIHYI